MMGRFPLLAIGVLLLWLVPLRADDFPQAVLIGGEPFRGTVERIDSDGTVHFATAAEPLAVKIRDLVRWGAYSDFAKVPQIVLADGGVAVGELMRLTDDELVAFSSVFGELQLPLSAVRGIVFQPSLDPRVRDRRFEQLLATKGANDVVLFDNGDVLHGSLSEFEAASGENPYDAIRVVAQGRPVRIETSKLAAMIFNPALVEPPPVSPPGAFWLGFADGSLLSVTKLQAEGGNVRLTVAGSIELAADTAIWQELTYIRPRGERLVWLSDREPVGYKHVPLLDASWPLGVDRGLAGGRMRSGGQVFPKGIAMHSTSRVAFDLDGKFRRIEADLAIDEAAGSLGSVQFRLFVFDAAGAWKPAFASPVIRGGERPVPMSVDVSGAKRIALIVEAADRGDVGDHADWLDARLIPAE